MKAEGEREDEQPSSEEEGAEQELPPDPPYDPLTYPWNDPASTTVVEHRLFPRREESTFRPDVRPPRQEGPYYGADELSELRRRLREETAAVPTRGTRWPIAPIVLVGFALLVFAVLADFVPGASAGAIWDASTGPVGRWVLIGTGVVVLALLLASFVVETLRGQQTVGTPTPVSTGGLRDETTDVAAPVSAGVLREETVVLPQRRRIWSITVRELVETLLLAVLIFLAVRTSMQNFRVEGASMNPSLDSGEYLIVNKLAYTQIDLGVFDWLPFVDAGDNPVHHLWDSPDRGDVIVFRSPTNVNRDFIKRIIGVPGDVVEINQETNEVLLNGGVIEETYIAGNTTCRASCGPWTVPEGAYFVMGDNRQNSSDSRQGWFVPEENIIGKALITYWHDGSPDIDLAPNHDVSFISEAAAEE